MAVDERRRHALHSAARRQLGEDEGDALMELLPPVGWADVATRRDIAALQTATKQDITTLQAATKQDITTLQAATKQDIAALQAATKQDIAALENRLLAAMHAELRRQTMHLMTILVPALLGTIIAAFSAARFG